MKPLNRDEVLLILRRFHEATGEPLIGEVMAGMVNITPVTLGELICALWPEYALTFTQEKMAEIAMYLIVYGAVLAENKILN